MANAVWVGVGGALGALLRFGMTGCVNRLAAGPFPWGTLSVNLIGSFCVGLVVGFLESTASAASAETLRLFLVVGVLGGFTTFSAFSAENLGLLRNGHYGFLALNVTVSVVLGVALTFAGYALSRHLLGR